MTMKSDSVLNTEPSGTNLEVGSYFSFGQNEVQSGWFRWYVQPGDIDSEPTAFGQVGLYALQQKLTALQKLERQFQERVAAVTLDPVAQKLLDSLDRETSIRWEDLPDKVDCNWSEACRSAALLARPRRGANLGEVSPTRFRLTEYGDKLLSESPLTRRTHSAIES